MRSPVKLVPLAFLLPLPLACGPTPARADPDRLPVVELTAFKDGHALVRREGAVPLEAGVARVDGLPEPIFGTFWPYAVGQDKNGEGATLKSATAGYQAVTLTRTPLTPEEILTAAVGTRVVIHESRGEADVSHEAEILGRPVRSAAERDRNDRDPAAGGQPSLPQRGAVIFLKTDAGVRVMPVSKITEFTLLGPVPDEIEETAIRTGLKLRIDSKNPDGEAVAGLSYVQKGFKWVPQYRVELGEEGKAKVTLQAALVNDLIDLEDATVRLVVGVPTFAFAGQTDPISLQVAYDQVSRAIHNYNGADFDGDFGDVLMMNSIQTQVRGRSRREAAEAAPAPEITGGARAEDLYVYTLEHITLAKGERMTVTVKEFEVPYEDRYAALLPLAPPRELLTDDAERRRVGALLAAGDVAHAVVLTNNSDAPFTTAPALLYRDGQILAQGLMTYAAPGGTSEVHLGNAVEVRTDLSETITGRRPEPNLRGQERFERITLKGTVEVTNRRPEPTTVHLTKLVPGTVEAASHDAKRRELGPADMAGYPDGAVNLSRYGVPNWWVSLNPTTEIEWELTVPPGETVAVTYEWHYFWRW